MCLSNTTTTNTEQQLINATNTQQQPVQPPKLVRGFSNTPHELLAKVVVAALKEDMPALEEADVSLKDCSGYGGCRTFKASLRDSSGSEEEQTRDVVLHSRLEDHNEHFMKRLSDAHAVFAAHELAPPRLAEGGDWFVGRWAGSAVGHSALQSIEGCARHGALYGRMHSMDPAWFAPHRASLLERAPHLKAVAPNSHMWAYLSRGHHCDNMCELYTTGPFEPLPGEPDILSMVADMTSPIAPQHPLASRLVTCHGDLHCENALDLGPDKPLQCIDFEFTCATGAYHDLGAAMGQIVWNSQEQGMERRRAFLQAYCAALGEPLDGAALDELLVDVMISGGISHFHNMGVLAPWSLKDLPREHIVTKLTAITQIATEIRQDPILQKKLLEDGLASTVAAHPVMVQVQKDLLKSSKAYQRLQAQLDSADSADPSVASSWHNFLLPGCCTAEEVQEEPEVLEGDFELITIRPSHDPKLTLQVKPGTELLELATLGTNEPTKNQQWRFRGELFQHVATGLFLDAPVQYLFNHRDTPWEAAGELYVRPRDEDQPDRQRWVVDGELIRHRLDGRALDVNFWELQPGSGVNLNAPRGSAEGCSWSMISLDGTALPASELVLERLTVEAPELDKEGTEESKTEAKAEARCWDRYNTLALEHGARLPTVRELQASGLAQLNVPKCWVPVSFTGAEYSDARCRISGNSPLSGMKGIQMPVPGGAAWARVETKAERKTLMVVKPQIPKASQAQVVLVVARGAEAAMDAVTPAPRCSTPIAAIPDGAEFYISPAASQGFGLMVGHDEKEPETVKLAKLTGDPCQKWTLVDGDAFRNVGNGEFLDADLAYSFVHHDSHVWEGNHTDLRTAPRTMTGSQKWVLGPEEFHGGKVLRHWMDGRGLDVHGWQVEKDGGNVGVENSVHGDCKGISYALRLCSSEAVIEEK